jgi:serine/threonine protein kinase
LLKTIGEGSFAKVKLAVHKLTHIKVAIKVVEKGKILEGFSAKNVLKEAKIMRLLEHQNIVQLFEVMETKKFLYLVLGLLRLTKIMLLVGLF